MKKVKVKVLDTYGVIASSPKQFDLDMSESSGACVRVWLWTSLWNNEMLT